MSEIGGIYTDSIIGTFPVFRTEKEQFPTPGNVGTTVRYTTTHEPQGRFRLIFFGLPLMITAWVNAISTMQNNPGPYSLTNDLGQFWTAVDIIAMSDPVVTPAFSLMIPTPNGYKESTLKCEIEAQILFLTEGY